MKRFEIGKHVPQKGGFSAFIPNSFPPATEIKLPIKLLSAHTEAVHLLGKLDGVFGLLPDKDWFLTMFVLKDAFSSCQIEGTNATIPDVIERQNIESRSGPLSDVDDILHYIDALEHGLKRGGESPFSLRFLRELHERLMEGEKTSQFPFMEEFRATQFSYFGEFRTTQNWIGGTGLDDARFIPPPVYEMHRALGDLKKFLQTDDEFPVLVKAGLLHAQFETIHPFIGGNGRMGRMLMSMFLCQEKLLESPVLYLSSYFKKHQKLYFERLNGYPNGKVSEWLAFFMDGIIATARSAIKTCNGVRELRDRDMQKISELGKTATQSTMNILENLYKMPVIGIADIVKWTGFSHKGGYNAINRLVEMKILKPMKTGGSAYAQKWIYSDYIALFSED